MIGVASRSCFSMALNFVLILASSQFRQNERSLQHPALLCAISYGFLRRNSSAGKMSNIRCLLTVVIYVHLTTLAASAFIPSHAITSPSVASFTEVSSKCGRLSTKLEASQTETNCEVTRRRILTGYFSKGLFSAAALQVLSFPSPTIAATNKTAITAYVSQI